MLHNHTSIISYAFFNSGCKLTTYTTSLQYLIIHHYCLFLLYFYNIIRPQDQGLKDIHLSPNLGCKLTTYTTSLQSHNTSLLFISALCL